MIEYIEKQCDSIYDSKKDLWGEPQVYKLVKFHPIKLKDSHLQNLYLKIFQHPKTFIQEKSILKSSYLKYLIYFVQNWIKPDGREIQDGLIEFLKAITQSEKVEIYIRLINLTELQRQTQDFGLENILISITINGVIFSEEDFDIVREIILRQNGLSTRYIEEYNPELEKHLQYLNSKSDGLTLEDEVIVFSVMMKKTYDEIGNYTLYQYRNSMERLILLHNFELFKPLEVSGQIFTKDKREIVKSYLSSLDRKMGRYSSILIDKDEFLNKNPFIRDENGKSHDSAMAEIMNKNKL